MAEKDTEDETLALAALFQSCTQIQRIASTGYMDEEAGAAVIRALLVTDPDTAEDVYPPERIKNGFSQIVAAFGRAEMRDLGVIEVTKTALKVMALDVTLERSGKIYDALGAKIDSLRDDILAKEPDFLDGSPSSVLKQEYVKSFADTYQSIISPNFAKLMICGQEACLRIPENQEKIRALLLAAIRAVVLWRQLGGKRRFLVFRRRAIVQCAQSHI